MDIRTKILLGLPSDSSPDEELSNGGFESGSGGASNYATGGEISYDGDDKIHKFTPANDGVDTFSVTNEITGARVLLVAGGGAGSSGGGGGGEVIELTNQTISAGDYTTQVGEGGDAPSNDNSPGDNGGDTVFNGTTASGGGGGGGIGDDGEDGGNGGGGGASSNTTTGGTGDQKDGAGNLGYTSSPQPAGGGGGAGGNGKGPSKIDVAGDGGIGLLSDITGEEVRYGPGGGGGSNFAGCWGGEGGDDGGGDGGYPPDDGEDGTGAGGGGVLVGGYSPGDGGNGVLIVRYEDSADYNFDNWTENAGSGHVFAEGSIVLSGSQSCKLTGGAEVYQSIDSGIVPGNRMVLTFNSCGSVTWEIYDNDNSAIIGSGSVSSVVGTWKEEVYAFEVPTGCEDLKVTLSGDDGYVDSVSLKDYGSIIWTENSDWLNKPGPFYGGGSLGNGPASVVQGTGGASFVLDNPDGVYSPGHPSCLAGFEEGMPVKIQIESEDIPETSIIKNGSFEENEADTGSGYAYYSWFTIDHDKVQADHTNFPVPFQGTFDGTGDEPDLRDSANGGRIQNVDDSGTITGADDVPADMVFSLSPDGSDPLSHEIELYDKTTGKITAWVKIPTMDADADLTVYLVYGNSSVTTSQEDISNVWTNYKDVKHFSMSSGSALDSTGNNDASAFGNPTYRQTGLTGYAVTLDGNDYFRKSGCDYYFHGQDRDTCVLAVADLNDNSADQYLYDTGTNDGAYMRVDDSDSQSAFWKIDDGVDDDFGAGSSGMYSAGWSIWHHDIEGGVDHKGYIDGDLDYNGSVTSVGDLADDPYIGARSSGTGGINGEFCEWRARQDAGDEDYNKTEANSFDVDNFITVGTEKEVLGRDTITDWETTRFVEIEETEVNNGSFAVRLESWPDAYSEIKQTLEVEPDLEYELSFYVKGAYKYDVYDMNDNQIEGSTGSKASYGEVTKTFTPEVGRVYIVIKNNAYSADLYVDDVQLIVNETYFLRTKFYGFITKIIPSPGKFNKPKTVVYCEDWIGFLNKTEMGSQSIATSTTADAGLTTLLPEFDRQPPGYYFDVGDVTFNYIFKDISSVSSMARAFYQLAWNEDGRIYCKGNGVLRFENASRRAGITEPAFTLDGTMSGLYVEFDVNRRYNIITLEGTNTKIDASATTTLWEVEDNLTIPAGTTVGPIKFYYTDPTTGRRISATDVVEPSGADLVKGANITISGWSAGQDSAEATFSNAGGSAETVSTFNIKGKGIYEYDKISVTKKDADSIYQIGERAFYRKLSLVSDPSTVSTRAEAIRDKYAPSNVKRAKIEVLVNQSSVLAKKLIEAEVSTRFTAIESQTGISSDFFLNRVSYKQETTLLFAILEAEVAS